MPLGPCRLLCAFAELLTWKPSISATGVLCTGLRGKLPKEIALPPSVTIPFGSFEEALGSKANAEIRKQLDSLMSDIPTHEAETVLKQCRELAMQVGLFAICPLSPAACLSNGLAVSLV